MISTRRIVAAVGLAMGVTGLAAPLATAAPVAPVGTQDTANPVALLDSISRTGIPPEHQAKMPRPSASLKQATDTLTPVTGRLID
ncbi:hypothetical protein NGF19_06775 [Streptomyces sp. RY43-2]|uniref:Uncharacterized protein n=1 Tax=Streptomyces macrolidinus TaxID=2952607 RepID=A0ABT0Z9S1_9ACTN|nr:hypothetical protein [Streptomyces macrolidinus]MCN9240498.1 hypothetical protein [Streptomyces macrolidinus]